MTELWYVVGFAVAGVAFVFLVIGLSWLITHRNRGDEHKGRPYESGIDTYGDTWGRFGLSFYIYALLFVAFDIEVTNQGMNKGLAKQRAENQQNVRFVI